MTATPVRFQDLGHGVTCIDTLLFRPGMAACYLIEHEGKAGFIDTGTNPSVPLLLATLQRKGLSPEDVTHIMPTHVHLDHAGGTGELMRRCENATLYIHPRGARHMVDPSRIEQGSIAVYGQEVFTKLFGTLIPVPQERVREVQDGQVLDFHGRELLFLHTEGHAKHHFCVFDALSKGIFTGDTFGSSYPELNQGRASFIFPPTTPVQFDPQAWQSSLDRIMALEPECIFVTHYGMHQNVEALCQQLRNWIREYAAIAEDLVEVEQRQGLIAERLMQASVNYLLDQQCGVDIDTIDALLANDMALNAQGLDYWLGSGQANG